MDGVRVGRVIRALRIRRSWRQADLAERVGCSQALIARVERGGADRLTTARLERIVQALGARLVVRVDWNGEAADRLLDADHAMLVELVVSYLRRAGWEATPEVTFAFGAERGSIDILAWHAGSATLLVIEAKSVVPDVQAMLATHDGKVRLADRIAPQHGWHPLRVGSLLVIAESRTARRRVEVHAATFQARFPDRAAAVQRFIGQPARYEPPHALWFLSVRTGAGSRQRVVKRRSPA